ncbi:hypothetical protein [Streptomyces sp. NBC_01614]|uniref:hypothetical protein n=1 Tax=Streptomyces sp. NBC_01614 TaxID=2975897 RepID=UPI00386F44C6
MKIGDGFCSCIRRQQARLGPETCPIGKGGDLSVVYVEYVSVVLGAPSTLVRRLALRHLEQLVARLIFHENWQVVHAIKEDPSPVPNDSCGEFPALHLFVADCRDSCRGSHAFLDRRSVSGRS